MAVNSDESLACITFQLNGITMPNRSTDSLLQLIHSLRKSEKRYFKMFVNTSGGQEDLRILQLFDAMDKLRDYDEAAILKKAPAVKKAQLSNVKAILYRELLVCLKHLHAGETDVYLHEQLSFARILYDKGLYHQSLRILEKVKESARARNQISFVMQALFFEKRIESLHITRSIESRAADLIQESGKELGEYELVNRLSNLSLEMYSWYIHHGHARNEEEARKVDQFFSEHIQSLVPLAKTFYQKMFLYQCYCWLAFIKQDFLLYYRYSQKWIDLFQEEPAMIAVDTIQYIKGWHNLLNAHFNTRNFEKFGADLQRFEAFTQTDIVQLSDNNSVQSFVYLYTARINYHFLTGTFAEGLQLVPVIHDHLEQYALHLDKHRVLVFYYKIASLYFGSGDFSRSIDYLNKIINWKIDLRVDLQCYARLLHLIAHYELGNFQLLEYLIKSVYRFMAKMENLSSVEQELFRFLKASFTMTTTDLKPALRTLLQQLRDMEQSPFEQRAFNYLDVISWLESKVSGLPVAAVIQDKAKKKVKNIER